MAYKRKYSGTTVTRRIRRRRNYRKYSKVGRYRGRRRYIPRAFPTSRVAKLKYAEEIVLNPTTSSIVYHDFVANGLYDPDSTGAGHQPSGFDNLMAGYDHYTVIGSRIKVTPVITGTSNQTPAYVAVGLYDEIAVPGSFSNINHMIEAGRLSKVSYNSIWTKLPQPIYKNFSMKKFFRRNGGTDSMRGTAVGNPSDKAFFSVMAASVGGNDPTQLTCLVEIEYIALFTEPTVLAQS